MSTVDAHHHFWRVDRQEHPWRTDDHGIIARDFEPAELRRELARAGVDATVLVQSVDTPEENDRLDRYAERFPPVAGIVAWLPLADAAAARAELDRARAERWVGARCLIGRDPLDWVSRPESRRLFTDLAAHDLAWDVVPVTDQQVRAVSTLARAVPSLRIVVDHLARPTLDTGDIEAWHARVATLASCANVAMKVSVGIDVLTSWPAWRRAELEPYVARAIDAFGPRRLMLASNWPVVTLRRDYAGAWHDLETTAAACGLDETERASVGGETATRWYGLDRRKAP